MENWHHQFWQNDPLRSIVNIKFNRHVRLCEMVKKKKKEIKLEYKNLILYYLQSCRLDGLT